MRINMPSVLENGQTVWKNQLGSEMKLEVVSPGVLKGTYDTNVGNSDGPMPLVGMYNIGEQYPSMGWVVQWKRKEDSKLDEKADGWTCTSWSGQILKTKEGIVIDASWLLTKQTEPNDAWKSRLVNCGRFVLQT